MSVKNKSRINIDVDSELKKEFRIKTVRNGETMASVLLKAIENYMKE